MDGDNNQGDVPLLLEEDGEKHTSVFDDDDDDDDDSLDSDAVHRISKADNQSLFERMSSKVQPGSSTYTR
jgi:hypothetical protein